LLFRYTKYLYEFEKERNNFSTDSQLQAAIDRNKRGGRRAESQVYSTPPFPLGLLFSLLIYIVLTARGMQKVSLILCLGYIIVHDWFE